MQWTLLIIPSLTTYTGFHDHGKKKKGYNNAPLFMFSIIKIGGLSFVSVGFGFIQCF